MKLTNLRRYAPVLYLALSVTACGGGDTNLPVEDLSATSTHSSSNSSAAETTTSEASTSASSATSLASSSSSSSTASASASSASSPSVSIAYEQNLLSIDVSAIADTNTSQSSATYTWDFGDGSASSGIKATHTYGAAGEYTVTLSSATQVMASRLISVGGVRSGLETGQVSPFSVCTTQNPNYVEPTYLPSSDLNTLSYSGQLAMKTYWSQASYNGTRMTKGSEFCTPVKTYKEAWIGFMFYLPATGYPIDKTAGIFQIFQAGTCSGSGSWAGMLNVVNNSLLMDHRGSCGTSTTATLLSDIPRDTWVPVIIHMVASQNNSGTIQVWVNGAEQASPTYSQSGINFGFGEWSSDTLITGYDQYFKFGQYNYDTDNYSSGETRTTYYDNINIIPTSRSDGWAAANPLNNGFDTRFASITASSQPIMSSSTTTGREAFRAFDGSTSTKWQASGTSAWLQYKFEEGQAKTVTAYSITSADNYASRDPKTWALLGSNDGQNWTSLDSRQSETFSSRGETRSYTIATPASYAYYRLKISANKSDSTATHLAELVLSY